MIKQGEYVTDGWDTLYFVSRIAKDYTTLIDLQTRDEIICTNERANMDYKTCLVFPEEDLKELQFAEADVRVRQTINRIDEMIVNWKGSYAKDIFNDNDDYGLYDLIVKYGLKYVYDSYIRYIKGEKYGK